MNINQRVIAALSGLGVPVVCGVYLGDENTYFTFNYTTVPTDFGDDAPAHETALVQVHLFCPLDFNSSSLRQKAKRSLFKADFSWPTVTDVGMEERVQSMGSQHIVFECEDAMQAE